MINRTALPLLPYHPKFERRESISSYIIRLANENGYRDLDIFLQLMFNTKHHIKDRFFQPLQHDFFPSNGFANLPVFCGYSEYELEATTLKHLIDYLTQEGQFPPPRPKRGWANRCFKKIFSYCPACVKEYSYYSLLWRFNDNPGCSEHAIRLIDQCYRCRSSLPLPLGYQNAEIGKCPLCESDLTRTPAVGLSSQELLAAQRFEFMAEYLISPHDRRERTRYLKIVRTQFASSVFQYIYFNYDQDLPEFRVFTNFDGYFKSKLDYKKFYYSRSEDPVPTLFTLYWLGASVNELMEMYLKYRDYPPALGHDFGTARPRILSKKFFFKLGTKGNANMPSRFDLIPSDLALERLRKLIRRMRDSVDELQRDLFYYPDKFDKISRKTLDELIALQREIQKIRELRNLKN